MCYNIKGLDKEQLLYRKATQQACPFIFFCQEKARYYMEEIWKDIKGFEGFYQISSLGRVKSLPRNGTIKNERILKPNNVGGYLQVVLNKKGDKSYKKVIQNGLLQVKTKYTLINWDYKNYTQEEEAKIIYQKRLCNLIQKII